jgi:hypothetical protein
MEGLADDPTPPADDEANDAALPEPTEPQGDDVGNDATEEES